MGEAINIPEKSVKLCSLQEENGVLNTPEVLYGYMLTLVALTIYVYLTGREFPYSVAAPEALCGMECRAKVLALP